MEEMEASELKGREVIDEDGFAIVRAERKSTESNAKRVDFMEVGVGPVVH